MLKGFGSQNYTDCRRWGLRSACLWIHRRTVEAMRGEGVVYLRHVGEEEKMRRAGSGEIVGLEDSVTGVPANVKSGRWLGGCVTRVVTAADTYISFH